jgi:nitroimidazol reductase NimA-like FMN-containing flavoprotein (pyridoxamine 5'-phosphate oxidase superfamily)
VAAEGNASLWSERVDVRQTAKRGDYSRETINAILDSAPYCQVAFVHGDYPVVLPMAFGRQGETLYVHGSSGSRLLRALRAGVPLCLSVTELTGLVLSRSALNHSVNYRSVVVMGRGRWIDDIAEREAAVKVILEHVVPGRWDNIRPPSLKELRRTAVLAIPLDEASAKIRQAPPYEEPEDIDLPYWGGEIPIRTYYDIPVSDAIAGATTDVPVHVLDLVHAHRADRSPDHA